MEKFETRVMNSSSHEQFKDIVLDMAIELDKIMEKNKK